MRHPVLDKLGAPLTSHRMHSYVHASAHPCPSNLCFVCVYGVAHLTSFGQEALRVAGDARTVTRCKEVRGGQRHARRARYRANAFTSAASLHPYALGFHTNTNAASRLAILRLAVAAADFFKLCGCG
jgi:hypothetical protein